MLKGKTTLILKDHKKSITSSNYRPITCLSTMGKNLTAQIRGEINYSFICLGNFSEEQKGRHKGTRGINDIQCINKHILKEAKTRRKKYSQCY